MFFRLRVAALAALFQGFFVQGIEFSGPKATPVVQNADYDANGWTPKPTGGARPVLELMRRQDEEDPSFCGYADGDVGMRRFRFCALFGSNSIFVDFLFKIKSFHLLMPMMLGLMENVFCFDAVLIFVLEYLL